MNFLLTLIEVFVVFGLMLLIYKMFNKNGLYGLAIVLSVISNVFIYKTINIFTYESVLGVVSGMAVLIISNIIVQKNGPEEIKKLLILIISSSFISYVILNIGGLISADNNSNLAFDELFNLNIRIFVANILSLVISIIFSSKLYHSLRRIKNQIWISNILSMFIICFIDAIIFVIIGYVGKVTTYEFFNLIVVGYMLKLIIGIIGTINIYLIANMKVKA